MSYYSNIFDGVSKDFSEIDRIISGNNNNNKSKTGDFSSLYLDVENKELSFVEEINNNNPNENSIKHVFNLQTIPMETRLRKASAHLQMIYDELINKSTNDRTFKIIDPEFEKLGEITYTDCSESSAFIKRHFPKLEDYCAKYARIIVDMEHIRKTRLFYRKNRIQSIERETKDHIIDCIQNVSNARTLLEVLVSLQRIYGQMEKHKGENDNELHNRTEDEKDSVTQASFDINNNCEPMQQEKKEESFDVENTNESVIQSKEDEFLIEHCGCVGQFE